MCPQGQSSILTGKGGYYICALTTTKDTKTITSSETFPDVNADSNEGIAANFLKKINVIQGRPDGNFDGNAPVNRAELAKFLLTAKKINIGNIKNNGISPDIISGEWYENYVMKAQSLGIIRGCPDGTFAPAKTVNTAEFLKMLVKTFGLKENLSYDYTDVVDSDWFGVYAGVAQKYSLFPNRSTQKLEPARNMTRNEVSVAIWKILSK